MPKKDTAKANPTFGVFTLEDLYNVLMEDIEPELTTYTINELDTKYKNESKKDHKKRIERYANAFMEFKKRFGILLDLWKGELIALRDAMIAKVKEKTTEEEQEKLSDIERSFGEQ